MQYETTLTYVITNGKTGVNRFNEYDDIYTVQ